MIHKKPQPLYLILIGCLIAIGILEILTRAISPQKTSSSIGFLSFQFNCFQKGTFHFLALKPSASCLLVSTWDEYDPVHFTTNSLGMRNEEVSIPKPTDAIRVLTLGDSIVFGWGVRDEHRFTNKAQQILQKEFPNKKIEIINAGVPATGLGRSYLSLRKYIDTLNPDIIIVEFYPYTDVGIDSNESIWEETDEHGLPTKIDSKLVYVDTHGMLKPKITFGPYRFPLLRDSHLFLFLYSLLDSNFNKALPAQQVINSACLYKPKSTGCGEIDTVKNKSKKLIQGISDLVKKADRKLVLMYVPSEFTVSDKVTAGKYGGLEAIILPWEKDHVHEEFTSYFQSISIDVLDLKPTFLANSTEQLFFTNDDHWNSAGHTIVAQALSQKLSPIISSLIDK